LVVGLHRRPAVHATAPSATPASPRAQSPFLPHSPPPQPHDESGRTQHHHTANPVRLTWSL
jgi:hypothetical protein